jgi:hypothetical protein
MAELQSTNVQGSLCVNGVAVGGGKDFKYCCFTSSDTWTPTQDLVDGDASVNVTLVGGGGGGGGAGAGYRFLTNSNAMNYSINEVVAYGGGGGGADMQQYLRPITATTACTVTVGAGGDGSSVSGTLAQNWVYCEFGDYFDSTGGDSSFGGCTAHGGGNGRTTRKSCSISCGVACCCFDSITRNGGDCRVVGGGAENVMEKGYGYTRFSHQGANAFYRCVFNCLENMAVSDRDFCWGTSNTTSSYYGFFPESNCGDSNDGAPNNGVKLEGGRYIGTNKLSVFENGAVCSSVNTEINWNSNVVCPFTYSLADSINCGGGGGVVCARVTGNTYNAAEAQAKGSKGGDGLVILKWFE